MRGVEIDEGRNRRVSGRESKVDCIRLAFSSVFAARNSPSLGESDLLHHEDSFNFLVHLSVSSLVRIAAAI